jgi:hypothetical protein
MKKILGISFVIALAISLKIYLFNIFKKAGLEGIFDFDLDEDIDNEEL